MTQEGRTEVTVDDVIRRHMADHVAPYYEWIRHVVTLATGSLTVLVSLQGHYVPKAPALPWALATAWIALALTIGSGLVALRWQYQSRIRAAEHLHGLRSTHGELAAVAYLARGSATNASPLHKWSVRLMSCALGTALCALCLFSVVNLLR